ncbi:MAG: hypothetical protein ACRC9Y_13445 [Aeromonas veronii]
MKNLTKHKIYTHAGNQFHVTSERADTSSTSDKFMRFCSGGGSTENPLVEHLIIAKDSVVAVESTPVKTKEKEFGKDGYILTFQQIKEIQARIFPHVKVNFSAVEGLRSYMTTHLNFGRGTGKTRAAVELASKEGNTLIARDFIVEKQLRDITKHANIITPWTINNCDWKHEEGRDALIVDEFGIFDKVGDYLDKDTIYKYAVASGYKHVLFLGE